MEWMPILLECARNVGRNIAPLIRNANKPGLSFGIGAGGDPMRQVDLAAERAVVDTLLAHEISFTLISEESGIMRYGDKPEESYVVVDPIDGTTNLTRGIPFYATSIAVSTKPEMQFVHAALVSDLFHNVTYTAERGCGAHRDGRRIYPSTEDSLDEVVIGVDLNTYKVREIAPRITGLLAKARHIRHLGANSLELCYVADGTTDAFIDIRGKLRVTDTAAAWLIVNEAGAKITTPTGEPLNARLDPRERVTFVAAGNERLHKIILDHIKA